jgi:hypothetical protein
LRSTAAADAIKFTIDKAAVQQPAIATTMNVAETVMMPQSVMAESQHTIPFSAEEQNRADMACSLDNPDACEACGS